MKLATLIAVAAGSLAFCGSAGAVQTVPTSPDGPSTPSGGWAVEYGDAFGAPLGTSSGDDNTLFPNVGYSCSSYGVQSSETDKMNVYSCSQASIDVNSGGPLKLACNYTPDVYEDTQNGVTYNYTCGFASSVRDNACSSSPSGYCGPSGYNLFNFRPYEGQTWAIQIEAQFPENTGEADPAYWSTDNAWTEENDWFEGFGQAAGVDGGWCNKSASYIGTAMPAVIYQTQPTEESVNGDLDICRNLGFNPSSAMHTYTTLIRGNNTVSEWVDGNPVAWTYGSGEGDTKLTVPSTTGAWIGLMLQYALRDDADGNPDPYFESGTRDFSVRYIEVFEDANANGANTVASGLAPGTALASGDNGSRRAAHR